ncbi:MAG: glycosyltransferase [Verrucomicrobia bacterium]|nr:glycosyltransferase [Verrucomicrobiota bacterium]
MRVLNVHSGNLYGGVETILTTLVQHREFCPGLELHFALCFDGRLRQELASSQAPVHPLGEARVRRPWSIFKARANLRRLLVGRPFELVVCHSAWSQALFAPVAKALGIPQVFWLHNRAAGDHWTERWARRTVPDLVLCVSQSTAASVGNLYARAPSEVCYSPLAWPAAGNSPADRAAVRAELGTATDATVIIQVSRMESWKGHRLHLEALGRLRDMPGWTCWQVGGAERPAELDYFAGLKERATQLEVAERVRFLGRRSDVPRLLSGADVFCQPNLDTEGFSIAFMEALAARLPIITTAIGGALEIVDETCGLLLPVNDVEALTAALRRLILEPATRHRLGAGGERRVRTLCDPERQMRRLHEIFQRVAAGGKAPPPGAGRSSR